MSFWQQWVRRPQSVWVRKAIFQIHLWTGIVFGLYVLLISVSGSAIVFRNELYKGLWPGPRIVPISGPRLSREALKDAVHQAWPNYNIRFIWESKQPNEATEVMMAKGNGANPSTTTRLFDPFTGRDLGRSRPISIGVLAWLQDLHFNLLAGATGKEVNGFLSIAVILMSVSGLVLWWPGVGRVRRSLKIDFKTNWKRLNWDLHSVIGLWMFAFVFIWGVTGVYVVFPTPFQKAVDRISPLELYKPLSQVESPAAVQIIRVADAAPRRRPPPVKRTAGDIFLRWFYYLHFGNVGGWPIKALWTLLGLAPPFLFVTGALMWWNRVLSREARALRRRDAAATTVA